MASRLLFCLLLASILVGCAGPQPDKVRVAPSIDYDRFKGSCTDWQSYVRDTGVQDCGGRKHPRWFGATRCVVASTGYTYRPKGSRGWFGRTCYTVELPRNTNQFKLQSVCTRIVDWVPPGGIGPACQVRRQNWLDRILAHEKYHIYQCENEVYKANQRWAADDHEYEACAFSAKAAYAKLNEKIQEALEHEQQRVMDEIDRQFEAFHQSADGQAISTDCAPCSAGQ
jgi:hypothetical protein